MTGILLTIRFLRSPTGLRVRKSFRPYRVYLWSAFAVAAAYSVIHEYLVYGW